jgi:hypothetical protein
MGVSGHSLNVAGWHGDISIANKTGTDPCAIHATAASVILTSSVTNGTGIHIDGTGEFVNESSVEPDHVAMLDADDIAQATLAAAQVTPIHSNNKLINDAEVIGDGTDGNDWRGVGVQPQ